MTPRRMAAAAACAALVLMTRVPFVAGTLDDIDAVNFALAVADFDPARHQPHPPGSPVYVLAAKAASLGREPGEVPRALGLLSALAQALLPLPLFAVFRRLGARTAVAALAAALTLLNPVVWINGVRPMSDSVGLLAAVCAQALLLRAAADPRRLPLASAALGLCAGIRVQTLALTAPAWLRGAVAGGRARAALGVAAAAVAVAAWAAPTIAESGGWSAYSRALAGTASDATVEPLVLGWTPNRALRAARDVLVLPWGTAWLGLAMGALAAAGAATARRGGISLRLAAILFVPYLAAHALFQQSHTLRYAMPYVPLLALLAASGISAAAGALPRRHAGRVFGLLAFAAAAACALVAVPGLAAYASTDAPGAAAMQAVRRHGRPGRDVVSGHYMFHRYFALAPAGIATLPPRPRLEVEALGEAWRAGSRAPVLFVAEPRRTDLESIDPAARTIRGRWAWPDAARRLLSGERPDAADLVEIQPPSWFTGSGWGLSLERASAGGAMPAERTAWIRGAGGDAVLLLAGEPTDASSSAFECTLTLGGARLDARSCGEPWLAAYSVGVAGRDTYAPLAFATRRGGTLAEAPFALRGLAFGPRGAALAVHGAGWHYPETDRDGRAFRWASGTARSLVHLPPAGGRVVVEGEVPPRHVALPATVTLESGGETARAVTSGRFRLELVAAPGPAREVVLRADREFVPDEVQRNGDRRRLAVKVDYFEVSAR